jgi:hypothetical protein
MIFAIGYINSRCYENPEINGEKLTNISERIARKGASQSDLDLIKKNHVQIKQCAMGWIKKRESWTECFFYNLVYAVEPKYSRLTEYRGIIWFHQLSLSLLDILVDTNDDETFIELQCLKNHYSGKNAFIEQDIDRLLRKQRH